MILQKDLNFTQEELKSQHFNAMTTWFVNVLVCNTFAFVYSGRTWCWWMVLILQPCRGSALSIQGACTALTQLLHHPTTIALLPGPPACTAERKPWEKRHRDTGVSSWGSRWCFIKVSSGFQVTNWLHSTYCGRVLLGTRASSSLAAKHRQLCQEQGRKKSVSRSCVRACVYETRKPNLPGTWNAAEVWQANWRCVCTSHI